MRMLTGIALLAAAVAAVGRVEAQAPPRLEVTPILGGTIFFADGPDQYALSRRGQDPLIVQGGSFRDAVTLGVESGVRLDDRFAIEGLFSWLPTRLTADNLPGPIDIDGYMYGVTGLFYVPVFTKYGPYGGLGVGAETYGYRSGSIEPQTHWQANLVGGLTFDLSERLGLRIEARDCLARWESGITGVANEWENDLMITAGINWRAVLSE